MHALTRAALFCAQPADETVTVAKLEAIALKDTERLDGKRVVAPKATGGPHRGVHLWGNRLSDTDLGANVTVLGTLRVIRHPASTIGSVTFSAFTEIRVEKK